MANVIRIFDTTLRDGEQSPGCSMTPLEKLEVAKQLERLNVDVIEAGFPASSPAEVEAIQNVSKAVRTPIICALARMTRPDIDRAREALKYAKRRRLHVFIATSEVHRKYKLRKSKEEILEILREHIAYGLKFFDDIEFSPEDGSRTEPDFLHEAVRTAIEAGATTINIPDTVGYAVPGEFAKLIEFLVSSNPEFLKDVYLSIHCHNDLGLGVANSLSAVLVGARQVECTINGIGERAGNAAMEEIVMTLDTRRDIFNAVTNINIKEITKASRLLSHLTGMAVQPNKAIVGKNAFAHEAGIHQDGILKMRQTYEIIDPRRIGRESHELVLGKHSGRHAFREKLKNMGFALKPQMFDETFERFKKLADMKKSIYDEDIEALVEDELTQIPEIWKFKSIALRTETGRKPEAVIVLEKKKKVIKAASSGDGPVDACFRAIDKITKIRSRLLEYSLEAVSPGEDALGEVKVKVRVGREEISGRGASTDIIEASVKAYLNALNRSRSRVLPKKTLRPPGRMI